MIHLELQPELEAQLTSQASDLGLSPGQYIEQIVTHQISIEDQGLQEGLDDIGAGRTRSARDVFADLHERHDIRG
jgi:predicted transcriptional regulator